MLGVSMDAIVVTHHDELQLALYTHKGEALVSLSRVDGIHFLTQVCATTAAHGCKSVR